VKNVFHHGVLKEEYMEIPLGFKTYNGRKKISLLKKVLYGLKQSPRTQFGRFTKTIVSLIHKQSKAKEIIPNS